MPAERGRGRAPASARPAPSQPADETPAPAPMLWARGRDRRRRASGAAKAGGGRAASRPRRAVLDHHRERPCAPQLPARAVCALLPIRAALPGARCLCRCSRAQVSSGAAKTRWALPPRRQQIDQLHRAGRYDREPALAQARSGSAASETGAPAALPPRPGPRPLWPALRCT